MSLPAEATPVTAAIAPAAAAADASASPAVDLPTTLLASLELQRRACARDPVPSYEERRADLAALRRFIVENREALIAAVNRDYGSRSRHETLFAELVPVLDGIRHARRHLRRWMRPERRRVDLLLFPGARNRVVPQPLGVVGVIVPWNFPINLSIGPLTSILAAGNRAMVKMSENSKALPFDHLLFTGSGATGRSVMANAARSLTPVTLELGGKAPAIVGPDFPIKTAAERILWV